MSTVQDNLLKLILRINPTTKTGKKFQSVANGGVTITGAASNGVPNLIRITAANHGFITGDHVSIYGVAGTVEANNTAANPYWIVTWISSSTFDLQGSTFTNAYSGSGAKATKFLVGSEDSSRFPRQRLLDIYNEARFALFNAIRESKDPAEIARLVSGTLQTGVAITFSASGSNVVATKPSGYLQHVSIIDASAVPIILIENERLQELRGGNPDYTLSATNLYAVETGTQFIIPGAFGAGAGKIDYYGITNWTWITDVLPNTSVESFSSDVEPILIELAEAIANEQSNIDTIALAKTLLNKKG